MAGPTPSDPVELAEEILDDARREGAARSLLLDVDGTLAPIAPTPEQAAVPAETRRTLGRLVRRGWRVVLVSGRPAAEVRSMVPVPGLHVFGSHGAEVAGGAGPDPDRVERMRALGREAEALAEACPAARVERKPAGLAIHDRQVADADLATWRERVDRWLAASDLDGLEVLRGKRVVELRAAGHDKGGVVRRLARYLELDGRRDRSFVAVGDDVTDEDMFRAIAGIGMGIRVAADGSETAAERRLGTTEDVARVLALLADATPLSRRTGTGR